MTDYRKMAKLLWNRNARCSCYTFIAVFLGLQFTKYAFISDRSIKCDSTENFDVLISSFRGINLMTNATILAKKPRCPNIATQMMRGRWKSRPLSNDEQIEIDKFLEIARGQHNIPKSLQRPDGKCGTVTYENLYWFRALCNPKGPTPCCFESQCVAKSPDECKCPNCYDLRSPIHAEYSTWIPEDPRCEVKNFSVFEACPLLQGMHLILVGDSFIRHIYTALLLILTNNRDDGPFTSRIPKEILDRCRGMHTFTEKICRQYVDFNTRHCKGLMSLSMRGYYSLAEKDEFHALVRALLHVKNTVLLVGVGVHDSFDYTRVYSEYIQPVAEMMKGQKAIWPRIIWATNHRFGWLTTPRRPYLENTNIEVFNKFMIEHLRQYNIPIFDTYNMTSGVMSQDGRHYGMGVNIMKAQMLLNFLQELKYQGKW